MAGRFDIFDRSIGKYDSELECKISLLHARPRRSPHSLSRDHLDVCVAIQFPGPEGPAADQIPISGNFPLTNKQAAVALKTKVPVWLSRCASAR